MADHSTMRLGKKARRHDPRTLQLARYLTGAGQAPPLQPPASVDYTQGSKNWGMMLNDQLGCCTIAAVGHAVQTWTANASQELTVPDSTILQYYERWDGYNPANPVTDQGGVELDVLNAWRQQGFSGQPLDAYVAIDLSGVRGPESGVKSPGTGNGGVGTGAPPSTQHPMLSVPPPTPSTQSPTPIPDIATAIWLFGGAYIGVELPITAQNQDVWDVPKNPGRNDEPGSWGGHAIYLVGYDFPCGAAVPAGSGGTPVPPQFTGGTPVPLLACITWGQVKKMTWAWFERYCSEAYALVSKDWLKASGMAPSGFNLPALENDLKLVTTQQAEGKRRSGGFTPPWRVEINGGNGGVNPPLPRARGVFHQPARA